MSEVSYSRSDTSHSAAELIPLESLVHHSAHCPYDLPLEEVHLIFRESGSDYLALIREGHVTGICARTRVGFLLGSRFGFALNSRIPAHEARVANPLVFTRSTLVRKILDRSLSRTADEFHEDVILIDDDSRLLGLIPTQALARLQTRLVDEQIEALRERHETERRQNLALFQSNQALRQTQALYRGLFESNATGMVLLDVLGRVQANNRRLTEILGRIPAAMGTFSLAELVREDDRPGFERWLSDHENGRATSGAREFHFELGLKGTRVLRISAGYIQETSQISGCIEDVTAQRVMEQHLQKQEKQEMLDALVGGIAHELNNKITPVLGFAQLLELEVDERGRGYLGYISKSVDEAARIIRQLLQLSKPRIGKPEAVNLEAVVNDVVAMMKFQIREAKAEVQNIPPPEPVKVFADSAQLKPTRSFYAILT